MGLKGEEISLAARIFRWSAHDVEESTIALAGTERSEDGGAVSAPGSATTRLWLSAFCRAGLVLACLNQASVEETCGNGARG